MKKTTSVEGEVSEFQFGWHDWERNEFYPLDMDEELPPELMTALREDGAAKVIVRLIRDGIGELQKAVAADLESLYLMIEGEDD